MRPEDGAERIRELAVRRGRGCRSRGHQVPPTRLEQVALLAHRGAEPTPYAVAHDGIPDRSTDGERDPRRLVPRREHGSTHLECPRSATTPMGDRPEHCAVTDGPDQAE